VERKECERTLWLQVSIYEAHQVQVLEGGYDFGGVEAGVLFREALAGPSLQCAEELAAHAVVHAEVEVLVGLERVVERHDERMVGGCEDFLGATTIRISTMDTEKSAFNAPALPAPA
jgi:hypothetical protein